MSQNYPRKKDPLNALDIIIDGFRIDRYLSEGGTSHIYRAQKNDTAYVIKFLKPDQAYGEALERFENEITELDHINHPHVIRIYGNGIWQDVPYMILEYASHGSIGEYLKTLERRNRFLNFGGVATYMGQIASALDYLHKRDVFHRDVKLGNILLRDINHAILTDFGIARSNYFQFTTLGIQQRPGTRRYMSLEQLQGHDPHPFDDQFSLGVVTYLIMTGEYPYPASDDETAIRQRQFPPTLPSYHNSNIQPDMDALLLQAIGKRQKRYATCTEFTDALRQRIELYNMQDVPLFAEDLSPYNVTDFSILTKQLRALNNPSTISETGSKDNKTSDQQSDSLTISRNLAAGIIIGLVIAFGLGFVSSNFNNLSDATEVFTKTVTTARQSAQIVDATSTLAIQPTEPISAYTPSNTHTATITATHTLTPTQTANATTISTDTPVPTSAVTQRTNNPAAVTVTRQTRIAATETMTPTFTPTLTRTPTAIPTDIPTRTPSSIATSTPIGTPVATATLIPTDTPTAIPTATQSIPSLAEELIDRMGTPLSFNCRKFMEIYVEFEQRVDETTPPFDNLAALLNDRNSFLRQTHDDFCMNDSDNPSVRLNTRVYSSLVTELRNNLLE